MDADERGADWPEAGRRTTTGLLAGPEAAPPPTRRRGTRVLAVGAVFALLAVVGATAVVLVHARRTISVDGLPVANAAEALADAEQQVRTRIVREHGTATGELHCWFSYVGEEATAPNPLVRCGPVLFARSDLRQPWLSFPATFTRDGDGATYHVTVSPRGTVTALVAREFLRRPDGATGPGDVEVPVPADFTGVLAVDPLDQVPTRDDAARLVGSTFQLRLTRSGVLDRMRTGSTTLVPPPGMKLAVAEVGVKDLRTDAERYTNRPGPTVTLDADTVHRSGLALPADANGSLRTLVAVVPEQAADVRLTVAEPGATQAIGLADGKRIGSEARVLYRRNTTGSMATPASQVSFAFDTSGVVTVHRTVALSITEAQLTWDTNGLHPSDPDHAFLKLSEVSARRDGPRLDELRLPPDRVRLRLPDGTMVDPRGSYTEVEFPGGVYWEVPWDFERGTIVIAPGTFEAFYGTPGGPEGTIRYDFHDARAEIPVVIPPG
jgi:hypothetical protein